MTVRVSGMGEDFRITIPSETPFIKLRRFIEKNIDWIKNQLLKRREEVLIQAGTILPIHGKSRVLTKSRQLQGPFALDETYLVIPDTNFSMPSYVKKILIGIALEYFERECSLYAKRLGVSYKKLSIKDTKSRWGSCSSDGNLMFSCRLILAPLKVSSYVAAHEVAHLVFLNHSREFWKTVGRVFPNYQEPRRWLKKNGSILHSFVF